MNYVLIIGSSNMDLNIYLDRFPIKGETVTGASFKQYLGGKGANQAVASVRSGAETKFIGRIGNDIYGDLMIQQLAMEGIDTSKIVRDQNEPSGIAFILIDKNGENMISVAPGANVNLSSKDIINNEELIRNAHVVIVQMEIPINTIEEIYKIASQGNCIKILNPAPLKLIPKHLFKNIDIIIPNEGELNRLNSLLNYPDVKDSGAEKLKQLSKNIADLGVKIVITTLGKKGVHIYNTQKSESIFIPAFKVEAVDTVGAGDCFNGVLASILSKNMPLIKAVKYGMAAASIAVTRKGAQQSMPYKEEIEERYEEFNKFLMV